MSYKIRLLKNIYLVATLVILIWFSAEALYLISVGSLTLGGSLIEFSILLSLMLIGALIYKFSREELANSRERLNSLVGYIGIVNLQLRQMETAFEDFKKYPKSKKELKGVLNSLAQKVLGIVDCDWVAFRIIELESKKILTECVQVRGELSFSRREIGNKDLAKNNSSDAETIIESDGENPRVKAFCLLPKKTISKNQKVLIEKIANDLCLFYFAFMVSAKAA